MMHIRWLTVVACLAFCIPALAQSAPLPEEWKAGLNRALSATNGPALRAAMAKMDGEEQVGASFLLAHMRPNQTAKLTEAILLEHVRYAYRARRELAWTKKLPEEVFRHYVLPILSGDEKIEAYRKIFWDEALPRLKKKRVKSLEAAALEVNRYCGSKVSFKGTPPEDSSPLEIMKRGYGRCEEEGIFFNAVARSVGVPARVASTPYWTFKASNHAWCEVYTGDGKRPWHFLGACEPSGKLDQAWFKGDVKRAALVLSRAIGKPDGDEILADLGSVSLINSTKYYTKTCRMTLVVRDAGGDTVPGAAVAMYVFNEVGNDPRLHDLFRSKVDAEGKLAFDLGPGDYVVHATSGGEGGFAVARSVIGKKATTEIVIGAPAPVSDGEKDGATGVRLLLGPGAKDSVAVVSPLDTLPLKAAAKLKVGRSGEVVALSPGRYLVETGRRKGDAAIHMTLQVVDVTDGTTTILRIPGRFPKKARKPDAGGGMFVLLYPR